MLDTMIQYGNRFFKFVGETINTAAFWERLSFKSGQKLLTDFLALFRGEDYQVKLTQQNAREALQLLTNS